MTPTESTELRSPRRIEPANAPYDSPEDVARDLLASSSAKSHEMDLMRYLTRGPYRLIRISWASCTRGRATRRFLGEVWVNEEGLAASTSANPLSSMVAGACNHRPGSLLLGGIQ